MSRILYFDEETLRWWVELIEQPDFHLEKYLPRADDHWFKEIMNLVELIRLDVYPDDLHAKAAHLFYKIIKNHRFPDGNKRSAVIVLYLFYFYNDFTLAETHAFVQSAGIRRIAKNVARQKARFHERSVRRLTEEFRRIATPDEGFTRS